MGGRGGERRGGAGRKLCDQSVWCRYICGRSHAVRYDIMGKKRGVLECISPFRRSTRNIFEGLYWLALRIYYLIKRIQLEKNITLQVQHIEPLTCTLQRTKTSGSGLPRPMLVSQDHLENPKVAQQQPGCRYVAKEQKLSSLPCLRNLPRRRTVDGIARIHIIGAMFG